MNGASIRYYRDANDVMVVVNPGVANRFVTSFSRPRGRDADARFTNANAFVAGEYCPTGPPPGDFSGGDINVAWASVPSGFSNDGWIARIALDVSAICASAADFSIHEPSNAPPNVFPVFLSDFCLDGHSWHDGTAYASYDNPTPIGMNWGVYTWNWPPHFCRADLDCDNVVTVSDLAIVLGSFGECWPSPAFDIRADFDGDDCVDLEDLSYMLTEFGSRGYPFLDCL